MLNEVRFEKVRDVGSYQEGYLCVHSSESVLAAPNDLECFSMTIH